MGKNIIVSEDTVRDLLEAHASLSAWYYELWSALRRANASSNVPDDAARAAFVERIAADFPEVASVARAIRVPRLFVPPPPIVDVARAAPKAAEGAAESASSPAGEPRIASAPAPEQGTRERGVPAPMDRAREPAGQQQAAARREGSEIAPPPMVIPSQVKYEQ